MKSNKIEDFVFAAYEGKTKTILSMLKKGVDINSKNDAGFTALSESIVKNNYELVKFLVENGADVNLTYHKKYNILHIAVDNSEIDPRIIELLISKIDDINATDKPHQNTALWYACHFGLPNKYRIAKILLDAGADIHSVNIYGKSALDMAAHRNIEELTILIEQYRTKTNQP